MLNAWVKIEVEDGYSKKANGYTWKRFKLNGKNYYIAAKYIQKYVTLKKPVLVSAKYSSTKDRVTVKWKKVNGAAGYYVYRKVKGGNWKKLGTVKTGTKVTYNNTSISHNVTYYYTVRAYRGDFTSSRNSTGVKVTVPKKVTYTKYKATSNVNYRKGAGTSYAKAGKIIKGKVVYVEDGYSKTANGYKWVRIKINDTKYYVALKYLKKA